MEEKGRTVVAGVKEAPEEVANIARIRIAEFQRLVTIPDVAGATSPKKGELRSPEGRCDGLEDINPAQGRQLR